jgi:hypothetical protein
MPQPMELGLIFWVAKLNLLTQLILVMLPGERTNVAEAVPIVGVGAGVETPFRLGNLQTPLVVIAPVTAVHLKTGVVEVEVHLLLVVGVLVEVLTRIPIPRITRVLTLWRTLCQRAVSGMNMALFVREKIVGLGFVKAVENIVQLKTEVMIDPTAHTLNTKIS